MITEIKLEGFIDDLTNPIGGLYFYFFFIFHNLVQKKCPTKIIVLKLKYSLDD